MPPAEVQAARSAETVARVTLETENFGNRAQRQAATAIREESKLSSLDDAFKEMEAFKPIDLDKLTKWNNRIGYEVNADGRIVRNPGTDALRRYTEANTLTTALTELIQRGYDRIPAADRVLVDNAINDAIDMWPEANATMPRGSLARTRAVLRIRANPALVLSARNAMEAFLTNPANEVADPEAVAQQRLLLEKKIVEETRLRAERAARNAERLAIQPAYMSWNPGGVEAATLAGIDIAAANTTRNTLINELSQVNQELLANRQDLIQASRYAPARVPGIELQLTALRDRRNEIQTIEIPDTDGIIANYNQRVQRRDEVRREYARLTNEITQMDTTLANIAPDMVELRRRVRSGESDRDAEEEGYVNKLKQVMVEAVKKTMAEKGKKVQAGQTIVTDELRKGEVDPVDRAVELTILNRWKQRQRNRILGILPRFREVNRRDQEAIDTDYQTLMTQGPRQLMENVLVAVPRLARMRAMGNAEKMASLQEQVVTSLLRTYLERNRMSVGDARRILSSNWGENLATKVQEGRAGEAEKLGEFREAEMMKAGWKEYLSHHTDGALFRRLAAILGIGAVAGVGLSHGIPLAAGQVAKGLTDAGFFFANAGPQKVGFEAASAATKAVVGAANATGEFATGVAQGTGIIAGPEVDVSPGGIPLKP